MYNYNYNMNYIISRTVKTDLLSLLNIGQQKSSLPPSEKNSGYDTVNTLFTTLCNPKIMKYLFIFYTRYIKTV